MIKIKRSASAPCGLLFFASALFAQTTQSATPPPGAVVLFDGTQTGETNWIYNNQKPATWPIVDSAMITANGDITAKQKFGDFQLHVEFKEPQLPPNVKGQARGNSGVYLQGRYEIQVLDSFGLIPKADDCGSIYGQKAPDVNACTPPETWQTYDITFKAARFGADGKKTDNARVTVIQNGQKIQDDVEIKGHTGQGADETPDPGPIRLQFHGNKVAYRNIWIVPAEGEKK